MPGQSTRFLTIPDAREQAATQRTSPVSGSDQVLRRYIDALRRREPNYAANSCVHAPAAGAQPGDNGEARHIARNVIADRYDEWR
jgi:hypothetical protein